MSNEVRYVGGDDSGFGDGLLGGIILGIVGGLAVYGVYKLVSSEADSRKSLAPSAEQRLLEDMINRNM